MCVAGRILRQPWWWCSVVVNASELIGFSVYLVAIVYHEPEYDGGALGGQGGRTDVGVKTAS